MSLACVSPFGPSVLRAPEGHMLATNISAEPKAVQLSAVPNRATLTTLSRLA